ncbi:MAG: hypothetical protein AAFR17_07860 [Pseudomonadota bacterium]
MADTDGPVFSEAYLRGISRDLAAAITHPEFLDRMVALREAPWEEKDEVRKRVDLEEMRALGVPIPDHMRVSPRTFERPEFAQVNGVQEMGREPGTDAEGVIEASYDTSTWGEEAAHLPALMEDPELIKATVMMGLDQVVDYVMTPPFQAAIGEMIALPEAARPAFVLSVFLDRAERIRRGIEPPKTMRIQRSTFRDGRPTLFCVCILTPLAYPWRKLTVTFDNDIVEAARANPAMGLRLADA